MRPVKEEVQEVDLFENEAKEEYAKDKLYDDDDTLGLGGMTDYGDILGGSGLAQNEFDLGDILGDGSEFMNMAKNDFDDSEDEEDEEDELKKLMGAEEVDDTGMDNEDLLNNTFDDNEI